MNPTHEDLDLDKLRITSVADLYFYEDVAFVRRAYAAILGRFPDPVGERYYLSRLRAGYSKIHLLGQLHRSHEGNDAATSVVGLQSKLRKHRRASRPGVAWLARAFGYSEGNSVSERQSRALLRELAAIRGAIASLATEGLRPAAHVPHAIPDAAPPVANVSDDPVHPEATHSLTSRGQEFFLPLAADSRTRRLVDALGREVLFEMRAI